MAVIAVVGGLGAPGATTSALALLLAWPLADGRKVLLVECDPDGGATLAGALEGRVEAVYGLRNLGVADRRGLLAEALWEQLIDVSPGGTGDRLLLPGLTDPAQAAGLAYTWEPLVEMLRGLHTQGYDVLLDLGRSGAHGPGAVLARRADCVAATIRTTLRGLSTARPRLTALREDLAAAGNGADGLGLLLVTEGPYPAADVTRELQLPVHGELPYAPRPARVLSDGGDSTDRRFIRSELMRAARTVADRLLAVAQERRRRLTPAQTSAGPEWGAPQPPQAPGWGEQPQVPGRGEQPQVPGRGEPQPVAHAPEVSGGFQGYAAGGYQQPEPSEGYQGHAAAAGYQQPEQGYAAGAGAGDGWGGPVPGTTDAAAGEPAVAASYGGARRGSEAGAMDAALRQQAWPDGWARTVRDGQEQSAATPQGRDAGIAGLARVVGDYALEPPPAPARAEEPAARSRLDGAAVPTGGAAELTPVPPGLVPGVPVAGQAFASPAGQVFVPQAGPVQVRPGAAAYSPATAGLPPLAGVAPHPAVSYPPASEGSLPLAGVASYPPATAGLPPLAGVAPHPAVSYPPASEGSLPLAGVASYPPATAGSPPLAGIAPHPAAPEPFPAPAEETETQGEVLRAR